MNILVKAVAGSHLFGTNTPASDKDFKGIYLPSKEDILLGTAKASVNLKTNKTDLKNTKDDVDVEFYSLQKFMQMLFEGQTVALELLWTPEDQIISSSPFWEELRSHRTELLHKKVTSFVGYCKTQADKYGVKGSRMGAVKNVLSVLTAYNSYNPYDRLEKIIDELKSIFNETEHVSFGSQETKNGIIPYMMVCDRMFQENTKIDYVRESLTKLYESYGHRAKQAESNEGIDWKALSHAYRVCCQAIEILQYGRLTLPLMEADRHMVRAIKQGLVPFNEFSPLLELKLATVLEWESMSELQPNFDYDKWCKEFVIKVYKEEVNK
jgi:predicted nucleotidyltransferase